MDISIDIVIEQLVPSMCQARVVHPTRAVLGFTQQPEDSGFRVRHGQGTGHVTERIAKEVRRRGDRHTFHWSKKLWPDRRSNQEDVRTGKSEKMVAARDFVFGNDPKLKEVFDSPHTVRGGLV